MSSDRAKFRHELKYLISEQEKELLIRRLSPFMHTDVHAVDNALHSAKQNNGYMIRSLYFDDCFERAYEEKLAGVEARKKYRIRIYNCSDKVIKLECKQKEGQYIYKTAAALTGEETEKIIAGEYDFLLRRNEKLCREFFVQCTINGMAPRVVVDYDRIPFVYPYGDVRVTFDCGIRAGLFTDNIFDGKLPVTGVIDSGMLIMEVKFTDYIPELIRRQLIVSDSAYMAYSKYTMCLEKKKELSGGY